MRLFERLDERRISVAFPDEEGESVFGFFTRGAEENYSESE
jgi:hypothetical protein